MSESTVTTRKEHLDWCKQRALAFVDQGDLRQAFDSFTSDICKHPETTATREIIVSLGIPLLRMGELGTADKMRKYIEGFN